MATDLLPTALDDSHEDGIVRPRSQTGSALVAVLKPLASLKLTVTLFALAIFLIFAGTLAQARHDIWWVLHNYFRSLLVWIEFQTFFPPAWYADSPWLVNMPGSFPFPGGFTIGGLMALNLLAAHGLRFKIQSAGSRLLGGVAVIAVGCAVTWLVIVAGPDKDGSQATSPIDWITLWKLFLVGIACACVAIAGALFRLDSKHQLERGVLAGIGVALLILLGFLLFHVDPQFLNPSAMRILWQLLKAEAAAAVLLVGCIMVFRKRAGIVLLHAGVGLIMANELVVHFLHKEEQMSIEQGSTAIYASDIRTTELAVIDRNSDPDKDVVTVVPESLLRQSLETGKPVVDSRLPFDVRAVKIFENSAEVPKLPDTKNLADAGDGKTWPIAEVRTLTGADAGEEINHPSIYVELIDKTTDKPLGTYLTTTVDSLTLPESVGGLGLTTTQQKIQVDGKEYEIALRYQRDYKPYSVRLNEVRGDNYLGTNTPRNYSSDLQLVDPTHDVDRRVLIRMNEPLRYRGETFYQSEFHPAAPMLGRPVPGTTLQVVTNFGWMIPYIACMIVATGLLWQFGQTLLRFLRRRDSAYLSLPRGEGRVQQDSPRRGEGASAKISNRGSSGATAGLPSSEHAQRAFADTANTSHSSIFVRFLPFVPAALAAAFLAYAAMPPSYGAREMDLYACGKLPLVSGGRVEPIDTLARNTLRLLSNKESYLEFSGLTLEQKDGALTVTNIAAGSPAEQAGIKVKDRIAQINGNPVDKMTLTGPVTGAVEKIDNPDGGKIELSIERGQAPPQTIVIKRQYQPAMRWLLEAIARPDEADQQRVFRIDNLDVLNMLGLPRREYYRYSWDEIDRNPDRLKDAADQLHDRNSATYSVFDKKLSELLARVSLYDVVRGAFAQHTLPAFPTAADLKDDPEGTKQRVDEIADRRRKVISAIQDLMQHSPPRAVPVSTKSDASDPNSKEKDEDTWEPYSLAWLEKYSAEILKQPINPATVAWEAIFDAYANHDAAAFNQAVAGYSAALATQPPPQLAGADTSFEAWYMHFGAFSWCMWIYFTGFCFAALAWLGWSKLLNRTAFWLILFTFLVHTFALVARMYISGRPPVTNLYSTAIFIGWGAVLVGLILESIYRLGYGNIVAGAAGFATLLISDKLTLLLEPSTGGDTIGVMQAVLDTQFWLATHVTVVNLGYMATYVAGLLGIVYIIRGLFTKSLSSSEGKDLLRMLYGSICFGMFFSFFGTVLGGLWADDSWGRFWGWDPKENGALIIVLWNALTLHARWDGMVKDRGLAVLAIGGNIVTSWSYFGVNQLGVGLHSYGFTEGVLLALAIFCASQLALIGVGLVPLRYWRSRQPSVA